MARDLANSIEFAKSRAKTKKNGTKSQPQYSYKLYILIKKVYIHNGESAEQKSNIL